MQDAWATESGAGTTSGPEGQGSMYVCVTKSWRDCHMERLASVAFRVSHSQATFSSCLLILLCVPHWLDPAQGWGRRAFLCAPLHQDPGSESRGEGERVTWGRQMKDAWDIGTFLLIGWFLWSDICGGVRWWWGLCSGVRESGTESHLLHLLTEWFSALLSSPSPYFLIL